MASGFKVMGFSTVVSTNEDMQYRNEPRFFEHLRSQAARNMAETILRDAARHEKTSDDLNVIHRWRVGIVTDMTEIDARLAQMEEARQEGREEAAAILRQAAGLFDRVASRHEGPCGFVIANELREQARKIAQHKPEPVDK